MSMDAVSLFCGLGGLELGARQAGFTIRVAVDSDRDSLESFRANLGVLKTGTIYRNIESLSISEVRHFGRLSERPLNLVMASLPNVKKGRESHHPQEQAALDLELSDQYLADPLLRRTFYLINGLNADAFLIESSQKLELELLRSPQFNTGEYQIQHWLLNSAAAGVAQRRRRHFFIGTRAGLRQPSQPPESGKVSSGDALRNLHCDEPREELGGKYGHVLAQIPPGGNWEALTAKRGCGEPVFPDTASYYSQFLRKLNPAEPSPTIVAQPGSYDGPFHWDNRKLTICEIKRLFGFPDDYVVVGNRASQRKQLGNSVPPPLARRIAQEVKKSLELGPWKAAPPKPETERGLVHGEGGGPSPVDV